MGAVINYSELLISTTVFKQTQGTIWDFAPYNVSLFMQEQIIYHTCQSASD